jgi:hypothetical protein
MTLENLLKINKLKRQAADRDEIVRLMEAVHRNLHDAHVSVISTATRFDAAYKAIMQMALLAMRASGYRPSTSEPGHHATLIQSLPLTVGLTSERMIVLDAMRKKRNLNDYGGSGVSEAEMAACIRAAEELLAEIKDWLSQHYPGVL